MTYQEAISGKKVMHKGRPAYVMYGLPMCEMVAIAYCDEIKNERREAHKIKVSELSHAIN